MNHRQLIKFLLIITISGCVQISALAQNNTASNFNDPRENVILQWNRVLKETVSTPGQQPATIMPVRSYAMMHAAMFDAVNSIDRTIHALFNGRAGMSNTRSTRSRRRASRARCFGRFVPESSGDLRIGISQFVEGIQRNRAAAGHRRRSEVAAQMLAARANDGWNATPPSYVLPTIAGQLAADSAANLLPAAFTHYPAVTPFALRRALNLRRLRRRL